LSYEAPGALWQNDSVLTKQYPHMVYKGGSSTNDTFASAMKRLQVLLCNRFDWHETHGRPRCGFVNCFGIHRAIFRSFDEWLHKARIDQPDPMARGEKLAALIMRAGASLHRNHAWRQFCDRPHQLRD
jgi:hypothetical protein